MAELSETVLSQIQVLCGEGDDLADEGEYAEALILYRAAWDLLPAPRTKHEQATWILGAIGDALYLSGDYKAGRENLTLAMTCPDAIGDPIMHLRLGQCEFELGNLDAAAAELGRAYQESGAKIFDEDEDKYFDFLKTRMTKPEGGW